MKSLNKTIFIICTSLLLIATGCSNKGADTPSALSETSNAVQQEQEAGSNEEDGQAESESGSEEVAFKTVTDEFGEVEVPVQPKRIVALYLEDYLSLLEVEPVVQWYHPNWGQQDYLGLDVPLYDSTSNPEALLEIAPDLIIGDGAVTADTYELFSKIAPTYRLPEDILLDPEAILKNIADLLGIPEKAEQALENYHKTMEQTKEKLQAAAGDETVAVVRLNVGDNTVALFGINNRYTGNIYHEMGLTPHPLARDMEAFQEVLSEEAIAKLDADHIIIFPSNGSWNDDANKASVEWLNSSIYQSLPAVKAGHVYIMERTHWQSGGMKANLMKAEDLLSAFAAQ